MNTPTSPNTAARNASVSQFEPTDYVAVTYVSFWAEGAVRASARLNLRTGVVDEIGRSEEGNDYEHLIEEGIESLGRQFYARTVYCRRLRGYRVKRPSLISAFSACNLRSVAKGDTPPPRSEYAPTGQQPAWSPNRYERLANLVRARLFSDAEARGETCEVENLPRISCKINPDTGVIELFEIPGNGKV